MSLTSGSINLSAPAQDRLLVRITVFEISQGQLTGVGYDSISYVINPGESSKSVFDRPDPNWIDFRAEIFEVNGQTSPPLTLNGVYTWNTQP